MYKRILIILVFFIVPNIYVSAQNLSSAQQNKIDEYTQLADKNIQENNNSVAANYLINVANIYRQVNMTDEAISNYSKALDLLGNSSNNSAKIQINTYLAYLYRGKNDFVNAEKYFTNSYILIRNSGSREEIASVVYNLGQIQENQNKFQEAVKNYDEALSIFLELNKWENSKTIAFKMANCYNKIGDNQNYLKYYNLYVSFDKKLKDEIISQKEHEAVVQTELAKQKDLKLKLELFKSKSMSDSLKMQQKINEQSQAEIDLQKLQIKQSELVIKNKEKLANQRHKIILILSIGLVLIFLFLLLILFFYFQNKKQKEKLKILYGELSNKNELIEFKNKELEVKNKHITDSINYACRIQHAILPTNINIEKNFKESFIFYLPRDVVSGDFYWFAEVDNYKIIATIDCTGHSVPGAFMSLIANTLLNEIVKTKKTTDLGLILTDLNHGIIKTLNTTVKDDSLNDGMDISIYRFEKDSRKAKFAAANHVSLLYVDGVQQLIESDFYSIGGFIETLDFKFTEKEIDLGKETVIYMFSDGYADQFNSENKKYMTKNFINFIDTVHQFPLSEQHIKIMDEYERWKGENRQIDDILVIGLKV